MSENEVEERKEEYRPPMFELVSMEVIDENTPRLDLEEIIEEGLGLCFRFKGHMYLYEYLEKDRLVDINEIKFNVKLVDVRKYDKKLLNICEDVFTIVKIVKTKERYYLLKIIDCEYENFDNHVVSKLDEILHEMQRDFFHYSENNIGLFI